MMWLAALGSLPAGAWRGDQERRPTGVVLEPLRPIRRLASAPDGATQRFASPAAGCGGPAGRPSPGTVMTRRVTSSVPAYEVVHQERGLVGHGSHHGASIASRWPIRQVPRSRPAPETENRLSRPSRTRGQCCFATDQLTVRTAPTVHDSSRQTVDLRAPPLDPRFDTAGSGAEGFDNVCLPLGA
jgi:hypothetical protein